MSAGGEAGSRRIEAPDRAWYSVDRVEDCVVIAVGGEIDAQTAPGLRDALDETGQSSAKIVLDLGHVTALDSAGLDVLAEAREHIRAQHGSVMVVAADEPVRSTLQQAGLPGVVKVFERVAEAMVSLVGVRHQP